jgi:DNA sulfur modification protein DndD
MKLIRAEFQNFRLLRDLELQFSIDPKRKLTVIRAANETGKTTLLSALQWALYGDSALPNKGEDYRLHPIDWDDSTKRRVPITVTVDFELTRVRKGPSGLVETRRNYRIVRSAFEEVSGKMWQRSSSTVKLFEMAEQGASPVSDPEAIINDELPPELREVFFTDGDRALSFIEADVSVSTKRERVQRAIRSLLGLGVIEDAIKHVKKASAEINKEAKGIGSGDKLSGIASQLEQIENEVTKLEADLEDAIKQFTTFDEKVSEIDKKIEATLQKGDKEKLRKDMEHVLKQIKQLDAQIEAANKEHSHLFRSAELSRDLLEPVIVAGFQKLADLHDKGKIPNTTIPVLEDRLATKLCICGESLDNTDIHGQQRCLHIAKLIDESRRADAIQSMVTDLYYGSKALLPPPKEEGVGWLAAYDKVVERRDGLNTLREDEGRKMRALELQLDSLPDADIQGLRETRRQYIQQRDRFLQKQSQAETQLENLQGERDRLKNERDRLLGEQKKGARILAELEVTQDVITVLQSSFARITSEELTKVSTLMNSIFLEMIGADPEQGAIINRAEISPTFDIIVFGPNDRTLNPDRDLNGASRRALTLAFILALTRVSEVEAPNVIDTPLGMTSGFVKRSVLRTAIRESAQLILFLTHDEIAGCEELIDEAAGKIVTLTNPAHYPVMLVNDPRESDRKVLKCGCNHRQECQICQRRLDIEPAAETAT